jgi:hypothetical protein
MSDNVNKYSTSGIAAILVIVFVGVYGLASLIGSYILFASLAARGKNIPVEQVPLLMALAAGGASAMTGLIGLLGRTSGSESSGAVPVTVENKKNDPVPVQASSGVPEQPDNKQTPAPVVDPPPLP